MEGNSVFFVLDSSVWVALFIDGDSQHEKAVGLMNAVSGYIYVPYTVVSEVATVITNKYSKEQADTFLQFVSNDHRCILMDNQYGIDIPAFLENADTLSFPDISIVTLALERRAELITLDKKMQNLFLKKREI